MGEEDFDSTLVAVFDSGEREVEGVSFILLSFRFINSLVTVVISEAFWAIILLMPPKISK